MTGKKTQASKQTDRQHLAVNLENADQWVKDFIVAPTTVQVFHGL